MREDGCHITQRPRHNWDMYNETIPAKHILEGKMDVIPRAVEVLHDNLDRIGRHLSSGENSGKNKTLRHMDEQGDYEGKKREKEEEGHIKEKDLRKADRNL